MTEIASRTKTPPTTARSSSCLQQIAMTPIDSADRERTGIAHEDLRRMTIEPKKAEAGPDQRRANNRQFAGKG